MSEPWCVLSQIIGDQRVYIAGRQRDAAGETS